MARRCRASTSWRRSTGGARGVTMSELSRMLLVSNGNATAVVDRLEREGLVRRRPSDTDRRTVHVALTAEGLEQFENLANDHEAEVDSLFAALTESDLDSLTDILKRARGSAAMTELAGLKALAFPVARGGPRRDPPPRPSRAEEPADLRELCGAARHVPAVALCDRCRCRRTRLEWRQFLLGRGCA